jgi:hypothetical protein
MTATVEPAGAVNDAKLAGPAADDSRAVAADEALARQLAERADRITELPCDPGIRRDN